MYHNIHEIYNWTLRKYKKFHSRYQQSLNTGRFYRLSQKKQQQIISRLRKIADRLRNLKHQLKIAAATGVITLVLNASPVQSQQLGPFAENRIKNPLPPPPSSPFNNEHPAIVDIDADGDLDVFFGTSSGTLAYFRNDGTPEEPLFVQIYGVSNPSNGIDVGNNATPSFADLDKDGDFDLIIGQQYQYLYSPSNNIQYFENTGSASSPVFTVPSGEHPVDNIFSDSSNGHPAFADMDNDGDLDAFVGGETGVYYGSPQFRNGETIKFWVNDGSLPIAQFSALEGSSNPISIVNPEFGGTLNRAAPVMIDIDNDGDFDMFVGDANGNIRYFRNDGNATSSSFPSEITGSSNPFDAFDVGAYASPEFGDFDNDGDYDAIVGGEIYPIVATRYFENIGISSNPIFVERVGIENPFDGLDVGNDASPTTIDIDTDGDLDIVIGNKYNEETLSLFINNGDGSFSEVTGASNPFDNIIVGSYERAMPEFADIDGDGDQDLFVATKYNGGPANAKVLFYRNGGSNNFTIDTSPITQNPNYTVISQTLGDFDKDGDFDVIIGRDPNQYTANTSFLYLENQGDASFPSFTEIDATIPPVNGANVDSGNSTYAMPTFVDLDHDGDLELVTGVHKFSRSGQLVYFDQSAGAFTEVTGANDPFMGIDVGGDSDPTFIDVDNDGDLDILVGNSSGRINFIENQNLAPQTMSNTASNSYTEDDAAITIDPTIALADDNSDDIIQATVAIVNNFVSGEDVLDVTLMGTATGSYNSSTGIYTISGREKIAIYEAMLQSVTYLNTSQNPDTNDRTIEFTAIDFDNTDPTLDAFAEAQTIVSVISVNDEPNANLSIGSLDYTENDGAVPIDNSITLSDVDDTNLESATVSITGNFDSGEDVLGFSNQNGITGSYNSSTGILTLTGSATIANYETALQSVTYENTSDDPDASQRTISVVVNDGNLDSPTEIKTVDITPENDPPTVTPTPGSASFTENGAPTVIDGNLTIEDVDSNNLTGATVAINTNYVNGQDVLGFTDQNGITGSFNASTGVLTLSGTTTANNYQAALQTVTYENTSEDPDTNTRTITFQVTDDGALLSNDGDRDVTVAPLNDPPVLSSTNTGSLDYTTNSQAMVVDDAINITDVDNVLFASATVTISGFIAGDVLGFISDPSITGSYDSQSGILTFSGSADDLKYETMMQSVEFSSSNGSGTRTIQFVLNDGADDSNTLTRDINITGTSNQPPVVNTTPQSTQSGSIVTINWCDLINDPDNLDSELTVTVQSTLSGATTTVTDCEISIDYSGTNFSGQDEIVIQACDPSNACASNTLTIDVQEEPPPSGTLEIFNAISPNGDGLNDTWQIDNLSTPNKIQLYNRWGDLVEELNDYVSDTPGALDDLPAGTYFYKIESPQGSFTGYIVIKK